MSHITAGNVEGSGWSVLVDGEIFVEFGYGPINCIKAIILAGKMRSVLPKEERT